MEKVVVNANLDRRCSNHEATSTCYNSWAQAELKGFSFYRTERCKACGAGKPATMLVQKTWKVSDKSPRRIQLLSLHFCFVFQSTLKGNQWTYKCADMTSYIVPLGLDTSAAMKQLSAGMALWHWHANEQSQQSVFQSLWMPDFSYFFL